MHPVIPVTARRRDGAREHVGFALRGTDGALRVNLAAGVAPGEELHVATTPADWNAPGFPHYTRPGAVPATSDRAWRRTLSDGTVVTCDFGGLGASAVAGAVEAARADTGRVVVLVAAAPPSLAHGLPENGARVLARLAVGVMPCGHELGGGLFVAVEGRALLEAHGAMLASPRDPPAIGAVAVTLHLLSAAGDARAAIFRALEPAAAG